jgi:tripartite-type tricarboxylate transporter receptor subunit TctC
MKCLHVLKRSVVTVILTLGLMMPGLIWQTAQAQEYPTQPVNMMIGFAVGGALDVLARVVAQEAGKTLGQEVVAVNKAGGGGAVVAGILASSKPDGYNLLAGVNASYTVTPHLEAVPYKSSDLAPIIQFGLLTTVIVVRSDGPYKTFNDLIEAARRNPGKISYGYPGVGTTPHLVMEQINQEKKANIAMVPFAGSLPAMTALLGGHIQVAGIGTPNVIKHVQAGTLRVLAVNAEKRSDQLPDVPTLAELGATVFCPVEMYIFAAPKGTPAPVVKKLEAAFRKAMETQTFKTAAENFGVYTRNPLSGDALMKSIEYTYAKNGDIIKKIIPTGK